MAKRTGDRAHTQKSTGFIVIQARRLRGFVQIGKASAATELHAAQHHTSIDAAKPE
jgi:hypothetical protein